METATVGKGKKARRKRLVFVLLFSGALDASAADNTDAYELAPIVQGQGLGKGQEPEAGNNQTGSARSASLGCLQPIHRQRYTSPGRQLTASKRPRS